MKRNKLQAKPNCPSFVVSNRKLDAAVVEGIVTPKKPNTVSAQTS